MNKEQKNVEGRPERTYYFGLGLTVVMCEPNAANSPSFELIIHLSLFDIRYSRVRLLRSPRRGTGPRIFRIVLIPRAEPGTLNVNLKELFHGGRWAALGSRVMEMDLTKSLFAAAIAASFAMSGSTLHAERRGVVPNHYEEAAVAQGKRLGVGRATLEGPARVEVMSRQTWTLVYRAGKAGVAKGGGVRVGVRHLPYWSPPQTSDPTGLGYLTARTEPARRIEIQPDCQRALFRQYFAWHQIVQVDFAQRGLEPNETLRVVYGDQRAGSPGMRVQPFDESCYVFKVYVDAVGNGDYLPLEESPSVEIVAAEPYRLNVVMPSNAVIGQPTWCLVRAEDRYGNPAARYRGTVHLACGDQSATLPPAYTFRASDKGVHRFTEIVFSRSGSARVIARDGEAPRARFSVTGNPVMVSTQRPDRLLLWGDLHGHTLMSDGRGTVEEYYDFADRVAGLDFCAVTDHAFEILDEMWEHSKEITNRANQPGRFVTLQGYEWSGTTPLGGDHNCYFLEDDPPLLRSTSYYDPANLQMYHGSAPKQERITDVFRELQKRLDNKDVFCIPHYGGRKGNPRWHDPKVQRMIEIFSEHRRSEDWATTFLTHGHRLGIIASTDDHYGNPGYGYLRPSFDWDAQEIGMAAVAVYAPRRTREAVFHALYDRHVYATSGDRIVLEFDADDHPMGSEFSSDAAPILQVHAVGTAPISRLQIKKNSQLVHETTPDAPAADCQWRDSDFQSGRPTYYYVRVLQANGEEAISSPIWVN